MQNVNQTIAALRDLGLTVEEPKGGRRNKEIGAALSGPGEFQATGSGISRSTRIFFTLSIFVDVQEDKVTSWDYDQPGDEENAKQFFKHSQLLKILN